jgi:hypothetical protein
MGIHVESVEVLFTPREMAWLCKQAAKGGFEVSVFIRRRALNADNQIPEQDSYLGFGQRREVNFSQGEGI